MKKRNLRIVFQGILAGLCLFSGSITFAGSVTVSGTSGTNPTYIVIPEEYAGMEGQFVATAYSKNTNSSVVYGTPYIVESEAYLEARYTTYGGYTYTLLCWP